MTYSMPICQVIGSRSLRTPRLRQCRCGRSLGSRRHFMLSACVGHVSIDTNSKEKEMKSSIDDEVKKNFTRSLWVDALQRGNQRETSYIFTHSTPLSTLERMSDEIPPSMSANEDRPQLVSQSALESHQEMNGPYYPQIAGSTSFWCSEEQQDQHRQPYLEYTHPPQYAGPSFTYHHLPASYALPPHQAFDANQQPSSFLPPFATPQQGVPQQSASTLCPQPFPYSFPHPVYDQPNPQHQPRNKRRLVDYNDASEIPAAELVHVHRPSMHLLTSWTTETVLDWDGNWMVKRVAYGDRETVVTNILRAVGEDNHAIEEWILERFRRCGQMVSNSKVANTKVKGKDGLTDSGECDCATRPLMGSGVMRL